jgi:hypothetical protein
MRLDFKNNYATACKATECFLSSLQTKKLWFFISELKQGGLKPNFSGSKF